MSNVLVPAILRSTLARVPIRGVPTLLCGLTRHTQRQPRQLCEVASGRWVDLDFRDPDQCMMYYRLYSRGVLHIANRFLRPGHTVWDIGGQLGYFAARFADLVGPAGHVVTFEPDPIVWPRLLDGVARSHPSTIDARNSAITSRSRAGSITLHVSPTAGWSTVVDTDEPSVDAVQVPADAIDDLVASGDLDPTNLGLIKLDIEGGEYAALLGMRETLAHHPTPVICEYNQHGLDLAGVSLADILRVFFDLGMRVQAIHEPRGFWRAGEPRLVDVLSPADVDFSLGDLLATPTA